MYPRVLSLAFCFAPSTHWPLAVLITTMVCSQLHAKDPPCFWPRVLLSSCPSQPLSLPTDPLSLVMPATTQIPCVQNSAHHYQPVFFFRVHILKAQYHHSSSLPYQKAGSFSKVGAANSNACEGTQAYSNACESTQAFFNRNKYIALNTVISM